MTEYNSESGGFVQTVINAITGAFTKFVGTFKKHGFLYCLFVMLLLILFYTLIVNPIRIDRIVEHRFEMMYEQQQRKEAETITRRLQADEIVGDIMTRLIDKFPAIHRCLVLEAHNSLKSLQNVDFLYFSCTLEMLTPNSRHLNYLSEDLQRQMRLNLIGRNMLNTMKHRKFLVYDNVSECKHPDHRLIQKIADTGDNEALFIPFLNDMHEPVILLVISGDELPTDEIVEYVNDFRKEIESCLM